MDENLKEDKIYIDAFNAKSQEIESHELTIDQNNDWLLTAKDGHFIKFPSSFSKKDVLKGLEEYQAANEGQINVEAQEAENKKRLDAFREDSEEEESEEEPE